MKPARRCLPIILPALLSLAGCDEDHFIGELADNHPPTIKLTGGPVEGGSAFYRVVFNWIGYDSDGRVDCYEFAFAEGNPLGFDPADTTGPDKWHRTTALDSTFYFRTDEFDENVDIYGRKHSIFSKTHTFFIRAVDDRGARSEVAYRSFVAWNLAPYVMIRKPLTPRPGMLQTLCSRIHFKWEAFDPLSKSYLTQPVDSVRYFWMPAYDKIMYDLNRDPGLFEDRWTPWFPIDAPGDSATTTVIGDDEILHAGSRYIFAVQAKDEAGAVTAVFDTGRNVRDFVIVRPEGPKLDVFEYNFRHVFNFIGHSTATKTIRVPAGMALFFQWFGDASHYGSEVMGYRFGWDILDFSDPAQWSGPISPYTRTAQARFFSGVHTLYIECWDSHGYTALAMITVYFFPVTMERNLLWIDDFYSTDFVQSDYAMPRESEHDAFWLDLCSRAAGFDPEVDVCQTIDNAFEPPEFERVAKYANIIWTYTDPFDVSGWGRMVNFTNEYGNNPPCRMRNYLPSYMTLGGHVWTLGKSDKCGGLAAVLRSPGYRSYPVNVMCEYSEESDGCADLLGTYSLAYREYCVTMLDKVRGSFRPHPEVPFRSEDWDALAYACKDRGDEITLAHPGLPDTLHLWTEVTKPGRFWDPAVRGFWYVEVYNPYYWMRYHGVQHQGCFHPMYRLRPRNTKSCLNNQTVAFWTTKYAEVDPGHPGTVAAPSVHFGFPLWFFNRSAATAIADVIFEEWGISNFSPD